MNSGLELDFDSVKICALFGRHTKRKAGFREICQMLDTCNLCAGQPLLSELLSYGSVEYRNYILTLPNGTMIIFWGGDPTVEQINLCKNWKPDIGIIQRSADPKSNEKRAAFAAEIGCKVVIPHHQDVYGPDDPQILLSFRDAFLHLVPNGIFIIPEHGRWMAL